MKAPREPEHAQVEVTTWVTKHVGGDGTGSKRFDEPLTPGDTPRSLLRRFTARFPELDCALWSPDHRELGSHIEVLVNDEVLGVTYELDTPLTGGERITLLGRRSLIDDRLYAAVPLVNGFRPGGNRGDFQAIESCRTVVALFDVDAEHGTTVAIRGQRVELAGTTIRAIAVNEFASFQ